MHESEICDKHTLEGLERETPCVPDSLQPLRVGLPPRVAIGTVSYCAYIPMLSYTRSTAHRVPIPKQHYKDEVVRG